MKKTVLTYGIIAGAIVATMMALTMGVWCANGEFEKGMIYGYSAMLIAFSMIFVATKTFRDKYNSGIISFGKAFKIGLWICLIASTMYVAAWLIEYYFFMPDFMDKYSAHMIDQINASGVSDAEKLKEIEKTRSMGEMYKNPVFIILMTYVEILPVGLLVSLISALVFKRKVAKVGVL